MLLPIPIHQIHLQGFIQSEVIVGGPCSSCHALKLSTNPLLHLLLCFSMATVYFKSCICFSLLFAIKIYFYCCYGHFDTKVQIDN